VTQQGLWFEKPLVCKPNKATCGKIGSDPGFIVTDEFTYEWIGWIRDK